MSSVNLYMTTCRLDLNARDLAAEKGGLCGLAALQQALASTVATKSGRTSINKDNLISS